MKVNIAPGKYVVAVSGGVDSMVLLDVLRRIPGVMLSVAHFDHGIRPDSPEDHKLVEAAARKYGLPFASEYGNLGPHASEAAARTARYTFLRRIASKQGAKVIVTAHHMDDLLETAILNMLRGTGRKGLTSLRSGAEIVRPLLHVSKQEVYTYAKAHGIIWREDSTNQNDNYLRNYIRHNLMPRLGEVGKRQLFAHIEKAQELNLAIDDLLRTDLQAQPSPSTLDRQWFVMLPYAVSCEVMAAWLRTNGVLRFDRKAIERLVVAAKVALPGKRTDIDGRHILLAARHVVRLIPRTTS